MIVWFAINHYYDTDEVYGPFLERRDAAECIVHSRDEYDNLEWWQDDWHLGEYEVGSYPDADTHICAATAKPYRPAYCERMRKEAREQRKANGETAICDELVYAKPYPVADASELLDNLKFGQELQVPIRKPRKSDKIELDN